MFSNHQTCSEVSMLVPAVPWTSRPVYLKLVNKSVKLRKYKIVYNAECWKEGTFIMKSANSEFHAFCKLYQADLDVSSKEKRAIEWHATTDQHKTNTRCAGKSFFASFFMHFDNSNWWQNICWRAVQSRSCSETSPVLKECGLLSETWEGDIWGLIIY